MSQSQTQTQTSDCGGITHVPRAGAALWAAEIEGSGGRQPGRLYQGGTTVFDGQEYGLVDMEEGGAAAPR